MMVNFLNTEYKATTFKDFLHFLEPITIFVFKALSQVESYTSFFLKISENLFHIVHSGRNSKEPTPGL